MQVYNLFIGCSGYYYPQWRGSFYRKGLPPSAWLSFYSNIFNTVELNGTFYRTPKLSDLKKYAEKTPPDFRFSVKVPRFLTHVKQLLNVKQDILDFMGLIGDGLGEKLGKVLFQLPPHFRYENEKLDRILCQLPPGPGQVIEFRDTSWWQKEVYQCFSQAGFTWCNMDHPKLVQPWVLTSEHFYLRLHGSPLLFKTSYSEGRLQEFKTNLPVGCRDYHIYFNNTMENGAHENARSLMGMFTPGRFFPHNSS